LVWSDTHIARFARLDEATGETGPAHGVGNPKLERNAKQQTEKPRTLRGKPVVAHGDSRQDACAGQAGKLDLHSMGCQTMTGLASVTRVLEIVLLMKFTLARQGGCWHGTMNDEG